MKKFLFLLLTLPLLWSCSGQNDTDVQSLREELMGKELHPVTFSVSNFHVESTDLIKSTAKSGEEESLTGFYVRYVVYKEDGSVYMNKQSPISFQLGSDSLDQKVTINEKLPVGNYTIAAFTYHTVDPFADKYEFNPTNFNSDTFRLRDQWNWQVNEAMCYESVPYTVSAYDAQNRPLDIQLKPMYSYIYIKILDSKTCVLPTDVNSILITPDRSNYGFYMKSKKSPEGWVTRNGDGPSSNMLAVMSTQAFKETDGAVSTWPLIMAETENVTITMRLGHDEPWAPQNNRVIETRIIYQGDIPNGKRIILTGNIGNSSKDQPFGMTIKGLEDLEIPFQD